MNYYSKDYGEYTVETWELETGYTVRLVTLHGGRITLSIGTEDHVFFMRVYEFWQHSKAQSEADALARFGSAGVAVAA